MLRSLIKGYGEAFQIYQVLQILHQGMTLFKKVILPGHHISTTAMRLHHIVIFSLLHCI